LEREDFDDPQRLEKLTCAAANKEVRLSTESFKKRFEPIVTQLRGGF
jgi:hypothetical protein